MNRSTLLIALLVAATARAAVASEPAVTADEIVQRHLTARGGAEAMRAIRSLVYSRGVYREGDYTGSGKAFMAFQRPYLRVVGNPESPGNFLEGYDGAAWEWYADPGIVVRTVGAAAGATRRGTLFMGPFLDYHERGTTIAVGEPATVDGRPAHRLVVTTRDGFVRDYMLDAETYLVVAERRSAPFHAFGDPVTSETRIGDYREVAGVLFPHRYRETDLASGEMMTEMHWGEIRANLELPTTWFSPPEFTRTRLQTFLEHLYVARADESAILWTYDEFRRAHPEIETRDGVESIGFQMLKMGDHRVAIGLLERNLRDHAESASAAFALGRAYATAGDRTRAADLYRRALELDPSHRRAAQELEALAAGESR